MAHKGGPCLYLLFTGYAFFAQVIFFFLSVIFAASLGVAHSIGNAQLQQVVGTRERLINEGHFWMAAFILLAESQQQLGDL